MVPQLVMGNVHVITHHILDDLRSSSSRVVPTPHATAKNNATVTRWLNALRGTLGKAETFVLPDEVLEWPLEDLVPVMDSAEAMLRAGILRAPYPVCVVQIALTIWIIAEQIMDDGSVGFYVQAATRKDDESRLFGYTTLIHPTLVDGPPHELGLGGQFDIGYDADPIPQGELDQTIMESARVVMCWLVMINCRGIGIDKVEPPAKLNRAREKRGKSAIPGYTVVTLRPVGDGQIRDRSADDDHAEGTVRRSPRVHWRRGHVSTRWGEPRWVQPVLVGRSNAWVEHRAYNIKG
ncbi:hypothetical protein FBZ85_10218 [Azospirillum brasilense]|nr:hypothetical protein [Azospirillum baldaniorum]TWA81644.1 hypothetical protein FBZ85_10218 [Azospirillum brasilense]